MRVLFLNQFFWPDSSATSQQLTDMAAGLAASGFDVHVLCAEGGYASAAGATPPANVHVTRVKTLPFVRGTLGRILSYLSFYVAALYHALTGPRPDVLVTLTTPPLISLVGTLVKLFRGSRHLVWEQDIYPDVATDLNYFRRGGLIDRAVGLFADFGRRHADSVIALGECMRQRLLARGLPSSRILIHENWANSQLIEPMPRPGDTRELVLLYSGNLGLAHDLDTLKHAMLALRPASGTPSRFRFLFVGGGGKRQELASFVAANQLDTVELRPYVDRDQLSAGLALGDIGLVTQHEVCCGSVVPSKVYGILASGRPVLFIGPRAATPALVIARYACGWQIDPGDTSGLVALLEQLAAHPEEVHAAGRRARTALLDHHDLPHAIARMATILRDTPRPPHRDAVSLFVKKVDSL